jgi:hypothetical protein
MYRDFQVHKGTFTNRSLLNGSTACVFILNAEAFKFLYSLVQFFITELIAICKALVAVGYLPPGQFLLYTDFLSIIYSLQTP